MYNIIIRNNGLNGFYKGFYFPLITNGTIHALVYGIYGNVMRCDTDEQRQNLLKRHMLIAGCSTGLAQAVLGCPIEVVKIRLQTLGYIGRSYDCMKYIYNHEGVYGLYRGLVPMIWRDILPYGIYMLVNDWMFEMCNKIAVVRAIRMQSETGNSELAIKLEALFTSLAALLASVVSWSLITPLDVVKTTMQAETNPNIHRNMLECVLMLWRAHNYRVLFSGIYMNIGKSFAILWGYQYCLSKCQACAVKRNEDRLYK
ncbi:CLUMA_CG012927, isoform A [Clunio marinus]|uniref:CLUMA_CG012927, isoform A n=1 Tax=Clunio marinus TaxID=568069 RepID=A0A1J1IH76_9DIPT|nr:CLUMA_CG012927, isoform A [Clunio marinus]